jgi:hypothetical protein
MGSMDEQDACDHDDSADNLDGVERLTEQGHGEDGGEHGLTEQRWRNE